MFAVITFFLVRNSHNQNTVSLNFCLLDESFYYIFNLISYEYVLQPLAIYISRYTSIYIYIDVNILNNGISIYIGFLTPHIVLHLPHLKPYIQIGLSVLINTYIIIHEEVRFVCNP